MMNVRGGVLLAFWFVLCAGCAAGEAANRWRGEVRDSAGLRIVENQDVGMWASGEAWRVQPGLSIGSGAGEEDDLVAVPDLAIDSRGRVLVVDVIARQVRVFDASGAFAGAIGREGEGPGEFSGFVNSIIIGAGDSVMVPDWGQARMSVFTADGQFVRQMSALPGVETLRWKTLEAGGFMLRGVTIGRDDEGFFTTYDALYRADAELSAIDTLIEFDYPRSPLGGPGVPVAPLIVNAAFWAQLDDGRIAWSSLDRSEILIHDSAGAPNAILRHDAWRRPPLTQEHESIMKERFREKFRVLGVNPDIVDNLDLRYEETLPAITALQSGPENTLWVQRMGDVSSIDPMVINTNDRTDGLGGTTWDVFDGELRFLGSIELPPRFRIVRFTEGSMWGVRKDENDVELVERLDLIRPD